MTIRTIYDDGDTLSRQPLPGCPSMPVYVAAVEARHSNAGTEYTAVVLAVYSADQTETAYRWARGPFSRPRATLKAARRQARKLARQYPGPRGYRPCEVAP